MGGHMVWAGAGWQVVLPLEAALCLQAGWGRRRCSGAMDVVWVAAAAKRSRTGVRVVLGGRGSSSRALVATVVQLRPDRLHSSSAGGCCCCCSLLPCLPRQSA